MSNFSQDEQVLVNPKRTKAETKDCLTFVTDPKGTKCGWTRELVPVRYKCAFNMSKQFSIGEEMFVLPVHSRDGFA